MSLQLLKKACKKYSQREVARKIGRSATTVNLILKEKYKKPEPILKLVKEVFTSLESDEVTCPTLGSIHKNVCSKYRTWASERRVHKDRLYGEVKESCMSCNVGVNDG